ncbi:MAG TPA: hypothetical protein VGR11_12040 [Solirubrobacteraceae bacterium]|nr:hypothetical protein [Solirubrobacteraceae bacterium]
MAAELSVDVPRGRGAPAVARKLARARFEQELPVRHLDDLLVIVSELTSNAVLHGAGDIRLRVSVENGRVYGELIDEGSSHVWFELSRHAEGEAVDPELGTHQRPPQLG